jgi:hypothetical protein
MLRTCSRATIEPLASGIQNQNDQEPGDSKYFNDPNLEE